MTGSSSPKDDAARHSGAGRFGILNMRPLSLFESGHSNGDVSLTALLAGEDARGNGEHLGFMEVVRRIVIGGWPGLLGADEDRAREWLDGYLAQVAEVDVQGLGAKRDPRNIRRLFASLGRSVGQAAKAVELAKDVGGDACQVCPDNVG